MMVTFAQYCIHGEKYYIHFFWWHAASSELMFLFENLPFRFFFLKISECNGDELSFIYRVLTDWELPQHVSVDKS